MAEIKFNNFGLDRQLLALKTAANNIETNTQISDEGVNTLSASMKYIEQHKQIGELYELYKKLILKDVIDINHMQQEVSILDRHLSNQLKK